MAFASIARVANGTGVKASTAGTTFTIAINPVAGSYYTLVSVSIPSSTVSVSQIQDTNTNSYSRINTISNGALTVELWGTVTNASSPGGTITVTLSATGTTAAGGAVSYANVLGVKTSVNATGATSPAATGNVSMLQRDNSFLIFGLGTASASTFSSSSASSVVVNTINTTGIANGFYEGLSLGGNPSTLSHTPFISISGLWAGTYLEMDGPIPGTGGGKLSWGYDSTTSPTTTDNVISVSAGANDSVLFGSLIVVLWRTTQKGGTLTCTDNINSGNYVQAYLQDETTGSTGEIACFYVLSSQAAAIGQLTVTMTSSVAGRLYLGVLVYSGQGLLQDGVSSVAFNTTVTATPSTGNVTPTLSGDIAIGLLSLPSSSLLIVSAESSGFTAELDDHMGTATYGHAHAADEFLNNTNTLAYSPTVSASTNGCIIGIALFNLGPLPGVGDTAALSGQYQLK